MAKEIIKVPIPGRILSVAVQVGSSVKEGDELCVLESMKMENPITSSVDGKVIEISVTTGQTVKTGDPLAVIEY